MGVRLCSCEAVLSECVVGHPVVPNAYRRIPDSCQHHRLLAAMTPIVSKNSERVTPETSKPRYL